MGKLTAGVGIRHVLEGDFCRDFTKRPADDSRARNEAQRMRSATKGRLDGYCYAVFLLRVDRRASRDAIFMRLLASTAAATHSSKRSRPSARQRFMPRPRNSTEMRPSIPARKRWPSLNSRVFS